MQTGHMQTWFLWLPNCENMCFMLSSCNESNRAGDINTIYNESILTHEPISLRLLKGLTCLIERTLHVLCDTCYSPWKWVKTHLTGVPAHSDQCWGGGVGVFFMSRISTSRRVGGTAEATGPDSSRMQKLLASPGRKAPSFLWLATGQRLMCLSFILTAETPSSSPWPPPPLLSKLVTHELSPPPSKGPRKG